MAFVLSIDPKVIPKYNQRDWLTLNCFKSAEISSFVSHGKDLGRNNFSLFISKKIHDAKPKKKHVKIEVLE